MTRNPVQDGDFVLAPLFGSLMNAHGAEGVLNGVVPSVGSGSFDIDTTAGDVFINNTVQAVSATTTALTSPSNDTDLDSGEFRVDLLSVDATGSINVSEGVAAAEPITKDIPTDEAVICAVVVSGNASSLQSADIYDYRTLLEDDADRYIDGGPHEIDAQEFAGGDGTQNQFLASDGTNALWDALPTRNFSFSFIANTGPNSGRSAQTWDNYIRTIDLTQFDSGVFRAEFTSDNGNGVTLEVTSTQSSTVIGSISTSSTSSVIAEDTALTIPGDSNTDVELSWSGDASQITFAAIHLRGSP